MNNKSGVVLVELLAVIVIIVVIVSISTSSIMGMFGESKSKILVLSSIEALEVAEIYFLDNPSHYEVSVTALVKEGYLNYTGTLDSFKVSRNKENQLTLINLLPNSN